MYNCYLQPNEGSILKKISNSENVRYRYDNKEITRNNSDKILVCKKTIITRYPVPSGNV